MELRRRPGAPHDEPPAEEDVAAATSEPPKAWHEFLSVRIIVAALALFILLHLFLWWVVYGFWRDQNHERLRKTVSEAWASLGAVLDHL